MGKITEHYRLNLPLRSDREKDYIYDLAEALEQSSLSDVEKMMHFSLYCPRQSIACFLYKYELFKRILNVHGSIIECGVAYGSGLMSFANFSSIFEPVNHTRKVIGFDTFEGFPSLTDKDNQHGDPNAKQGGMKVESFDELKRVVDVFDLNRFVGHIDKVELVKGDITKTAPQYLEDNPHLVVSLLYLDLDLYEPTKTAIETFLPRMPKGSIIAFDELNHPDWPGETQAVLEDIGINNLRIERFPFDSVRSFAVIGG
ncbi:MAG: class I SAM-dependent methyltransferase [Planctomycetes bacterium]|nr:class I SAM-dependent methyltransferase [Planctomycetota bacterium]